MQDLRQQLRCILGSPGRVALVGIGNPDRRDDGAGVRLVRRIASEKARRQHETGAVHREGLARLDLIEAGTEPERCCAQLVEGGFSRVLFVDAVASGGPPGTVVLADSDQMASDYLQVSTHRLGLGLLAKYIEQVAKARVWLLGVQPDCMGPGTALTPAVAESLGVLEQLVMEAGEVSAC